MTGTVSERAVAINLGECLLRGDLRIPAEACGIVLFAHGSGSGRLSPRNLYVAEHLNRKRLATLLMDLLTEEEEKEDRVTGRLRFDIGLLSDRLSAATNWLKLDDQVRGLPVGYFGASTGAAAALIASTLHPSVVRAIVSRGGRADMAGPALKNVQAPTLLIVGGEDTTVVELNRMAMEEMVNEPQLQVLPAAGHLFEEPGKLDEVSELAGDWFVRHLCGDLE